MISAVSVATRGRVNAGQAVVFAAIGWVLVAVTPVPSPSQVVTSNQGSGGGYGEIINTTQTISTSERRKNFVLRDDAEILNLIKIFLECQK